MQKIIDAEKSDLFDVLAYVAYALPPLTREERADEAKVYDSAPASPPSSRPFSISCWRTTSRSASRNSTRRSSRPLLKLKYHDSIADAVADLGRPEEIGSVFAGFQKYLYQPSSAA